MPDINVAGIVTIEDAGEGKCDVTMWDKEGNGYVVVCLEAMDAWQVAKTMQDYLATWLND